MGKRLTPTDDERYRDYLAKKTARAAEIEAARADDDTWDGSARPRAWSRAASKKAAIDRQTGGPQPAIRPFIKPSTRNRVRTP